jgi:hypothetical protein
MLTTVLPQLIDRAGDGTVAPGLLNDQAARILGQGSFDHDISKLHKRIMEERDKFRSRDLSQRAARLPITDPHRTAFFSNSSDSFSKSLYSGLPVLNVHFTNTEWSTANALHFGVPIPALRAHVSKHL